MGRVSIHRSLHPGPWAAALAAAAFLALVPAGCAVGVGGGNNRFASRQGIFLDSAVEGLEFNAGGLFGTTDASGGFLYDPGTPVTFFVGDIQVGTGPGAVVMTPLSFVNAATDETDGTVTNITRFLMTIDDDRDPENGIQISDNVRQVAKGLSIDFTFPPSTFAGNNGAALGALSSATSVGGSTVSERVAQDHLRRTLLTLLAGTYGGDFAGADTGTWEMTVDPEGNVTASSVSSATSDAFSMTGTVKSSGRGLSFASTNGVKFDGTIAVDGTVSGNWQRLVPTDFGAGDTEFGTFTGARLS